MTKHRQFELVEPVKYLDWLAQHSLPFGAVRSKAVSAKELSREFPAPQNENVREP